MSVTRFLIVLLAFWAPITGRAFVMPQWNILSTPLSSAVAASDNMVKHAGDTALNRVEWFGSLVSKSAEQSRQFSKTKEPRDERELEGTGGTVYSKLATTVDSVDVNKERQVWAALANLEQDSKSII